MERSEQSVKLPKRLLFQVIFIVIEPTKNITSSPCLVENLEKSFDQKKVDCNILDHSLPSHLDVHDEIVDLGLIPLFLAKHLVLALNPDSPKGNTTKKVPNFNLFDKVL